VRKQIRGFRHGQNPLTLHPQAEALLHAVSFLEPLDTPGGIDKFLLTDLVERVRNELPHKHLTVTSEYFG